MSSTAAANEPGSSLRYYFAGCRKEILQWTVAVLAVVFIFPLVAVAGEGIGRFAAHLYAEHTKHDPPLDAAERGVRTDA